MGLSLIDCFYVHHLACLHLGKLLGMLTEPVDLNDLVTLGLGCYGGLGRFTFPYVRHTACFLILFGCVGSWDWWGSLVWLGPCTMG